MMRSSPPSLSRLFQGALACSVIVVAACAGDGTTGPGGSHAVTLSFSNAAASTGAVGQVNTLASATRLVPAPHTDIIAGSGTDTLVITKAQVVFSNIELTGSTTSTCVSNSDDDSGTDVGSADCHEVERSLVLVDLPVDNAVSTVVDADIPPGSYSKLEAKLRAAHATDDTNATSFLTAHPEFQGVNVRVEGTFNHTPFVYTGNVTSRLEFFFLPPITVTNSALNITIAVHMESWFKRGDGTLIDPATANLGGVNADLVAQSIRGSFRAFRDDDRHGDDDNSGQGSNNSGPGNGGGGNY